jgi:DNA-binding transcriptional MerR regulator
MIEPLAPLELPDKPTFKPSEVCDLVGVPSYVLRTWENEFKDLGVTRAQGTARIYRRQDVELAWRIKVLVFTEHLTLAGVRRRLEQEQLLTPPVEDLGEAIGTDAAPGGLTGPQREKLDDVKRELRSLLEALGPGRQSPAPARKSAPAGEPADQPKSRSRGERARRGPGGVSPGLPGLGEAADGTPPAETSATRLDPSALNFASVTVLPPPGSRKPR